MKKHTPLYNIFTFISSLLIFSQLQAQSTIEQDEMFTTLLNEKRKQNQELNFKNGFKIQVYSGDFNAAEKTISDLKFKFENLDSSLEFNAPSYKVRIGNFTNKIDAERNLRLIQKEYPIAFIVKPGRN